MTESKKSESRKLPYLDRAEGERLAREMVPSMVKRVSRKLGIPLEEPPKKQKFVGKTAVATETRMAHSQTPTVEVEVMTKVTQNFPAGKDVDDRHIRSPFNSKRSNDKDTLKTQQEEENRRAESVTPVDMGQKIDPVRVTESEQKQTPAQEESEDHRMKTFVESVSDGELLILMNENGSKAYYRRSGDDLVGRNDSTVKTESAWKRHQNGWKLAESDIKAVPKEIPAKQDVEAPLSVTHTDDTATEEDYASGKVFADQYLELHPPLAEAGERPDDVMKAAESEKPEAISLPEKGGDGEDVVKLTEAIDAEIAQLKMEVAISRAEYIKEKHETISTVDKLKNILGMKVGGDIKHPYQDSYREQLSLLKEKELERLRLLGNSGAELGKEMEGILSYFRVKEATNLIEAYDAYRSEDESWSQKTVNTGRAIGEWYNRQSFKKKILIGSLVTLGVAGTGLAGGGALIGSSVLFVKKMIASAGLSVAFDANADQKTMTHFREQAWEEINVELGEILGKKEETSSGSWEDRINHLNDILDKSSVELDPTFERLISERKLNGVKSVVKGFGIVFGGGAAVQYSMNELGGNEAVDWTKNHIANAFHGSEIPPANIPIPAEPKPLIPVETQPIANPDVISDTLGKEYVVQKGDSVWKIAGGLADKLGLKDAQRTHFIDTLKNQYGDVQLKTGETINFSNHGIDKDFVENALGRATSLTIDQTTSIDANDVKIAEFASSHPDVTLTNAKVDEILRGDFANQSDAIKMTDGNVFSATDNSVDLNTPVESAVIGSLDTSGSVENAIQNNINFTDPKAYLMEHPEDFSRFNTTLGRIRMNIFTMNGGEAGVPTEYDYTVNGQKLGATKISDVLRDVNGFKNENLRYGYDRTENPLHYDQMKELARFTEASKKAFGVKFSQVEAGENIDHYTRRMATAALRTGKEIKGFFKP